MNDDLPNWLRSGGFVPEHDDTDWDELAAALELPALFENAVEVAASLLPTSDPWSDREIVPVRLTEEQYRRLRE